MAQLVEQLLLTPEIGGSNLVIGTILSTKLSTNCIIEKMKIKIQEAGNSPSIFKKGYLTENNLRTAGSQYFSTALYLIFCKYWDYTSVLFLNR